MAIRTAPKPEPAATGRALPVENPRFDKVAYQREYMRKKRAGAAPTVWVRFPSDAVNAWKATGEGWECRMAAALVAPPLY